ncbi:acyl-CoA dehydrogenase family protein [Paraburkholderia sp.]|uniref:acyl-CoA dehydrogenase family protein n=1 Tax=Paraburkholderia sp. TaxID=1926495 RepID=UPI0025EA03CE|nr:acyl-CoA dehydrogenase family protein [Paraburkholderia sp.]
MSETADMIAESIGRIFSDHVNREVLDGIEAGVWPEALWNTLETAGFTAILGEPGDDATSQWADAYCVFHAIGRYTAPVPLAETAIANWLCAAHGMPPVPGPLTFFDAGDNATLNDDVLTLDAEVRAVPWARYARAFVVEARVGGRSVLAVIPAGAEGLTIEPGANLAGEPLDTVRLAGYRTTSHVVTGTPVEVRAYGALARSAMMAGAVESVLFSAVSYANERTQFGRPIGKFQAIQQSLAQLAGEATSAQSAALAAFSSVIGSPGRFETAVAKIRAGKAVGLAASIAHQVHGAIGFTWEHTLHYATQRLWSWRAEYGTEAVWAEELGRNAIAQRGDRLWPDLTAHYAGGRTHVAG